MLYITGQLLTHFSYDLILRPLRQLAAWKKVDEFARSDIDWMADYTFIRHKDAALGLEISKRYARTIKRKRSGPQDEGQSRQPRQNFPPAVRLGETTIHPHDTPLRPL
jgi:hypothetical protein